MAGAPTRERPARLSASMSIEQFLAWQEEDVHAEWIDGKVITMSPASQKHQDIIDFLSALLRIFVETRTLGKSISAPFSMRLASRPSVREPDLLFVRTENLDRLTQTYLDGPADLAVEIISPESIGRDRGEKFVEYEQAGIPEYWLIDPIREQAEFYVLEKERYRLAPLPDGVFHSPILPGFYLRPEWFWRAPLPNIVQILKELGIL